MNLLLNIIGYLFIQSCSLPESYGDVNEPTNAFVFYLVYGGSILIVIYVFILVISRMIQPKEKSKEHIKRKILMDL